MAKLTGEERHRGNRERTSTPQDPAPVPEVYLPATTSLNAMSAAGARPDPPPIEGPLPASPLKARVTKSWSGGASTLQPLSPSLASLGALRQNDQTPVMSSGDFHFLAACGRTEELARLLSGAQPPARPRGNQAGMRKPAKREMLPGVDVDVRDGHQRTMLTCATLAGHLDTCRLLLELGADANVSIHNACTPLHLACGTDAGRGPELVAELLGAGARSSVNAVNMKGWSPLHVCVAMRVCQGGEAARDARRAADPGTNGILSWLWRPTHGPGRREPDTEGQLSPQQQQEVDSIIRLLADAGANLDMVCQMAGGCAARPLYGTTPLAELLAYAGDLEEAGVDRFGHTLDAALGLASTLVQCGAKVDAPDAKGCTHLWKACLYGHVTVAHWLLAHGAAHDGMYSGRSPLAACITGNPRRRSDPHASATPSPPASVTHTTPRHEPVTAAGHGNHGVPSHGKGGAHPTPGQSTTIPRAPSHPGVVASSSSSGGGGGPAAGASTSTAAATVATAAAAAALAQQRVVRTLLVRSLLDAGADPNVGTALGATPLLLACVNGMQEAADLVISAGAYYRCAPTAFPPHIPEGTGVLDVCLDREAGQDKGQGDADVLLALVVALLDRRCLLPACTASKARRGGGGEGEADGAHEGVAGSARGEDGARAGGQGNEDEAEEYLLRCGGCQLAGYCCKEHQVADWPAHRLECPRMKMYYDERVAGDAEGAA